MGSSDADSGAGFDADTAGEDGTETPGTADSTGRSRPRAAVIAAGLAVVLLGSSLLVRSTPIVDPAVAAVAVAVLASLGAALLWRRGAAADERDPDGDSDVWNAIPAWQYDGRHVESGGLTRSEQESALRDIQRQADELDERERN